MNEEQDALEAPDEQLEPAQGRCTIYLYDVNGGSGDLSEPEVQSLFGAFQSSPLVGDSPDRYGFVQMTLLDSSVIYGFFAQEYRRTRVDYDHLKRQLIADERDFERYLFILQPAGHHLLLQHRRSFHPHLAPWSAVYDRFFALLQLTFNNAGLAPPSSLTVASIGTTREEFIEYFNNPEMRITHLDLEDFDAGILPPSGTCQ